MQSVGAPDFTQSSVLYKHNESVNDMEKSLEKTVINEFNVKIKKSDFVGLIIDEKVNITVICKTRKRRTSRNVLFGKL